MTKAVWSFCRFLHFVTTKGGLNSLSERSEIVNAESQYQTTIVPKLSWLKIDPRQFASSREATVLVCNAKKAVLSCDRLSKAGDWAITTADLFNHLNAILF